MIKKLAFVLLIVFLILPLPVISGEIKNIQSSPSYENPEEMLEDGVKMIMSALKLVLKTIPPYEMPDVMDNGDIIIRRIKPKKDARDSLKNI